MKGENMFIGLMNSAFFAGALAALIAGATGCAMTEPLVTEHLQEELKDPRVSIVTLRFKSPQLPPAKGLFNSGMNKRPWIFAIANESTGWNFRLLDYFSMVFRTGDDSLEQNPSNTATGWVTFLSPPGLSYIAVSTFASISLERPNLVAKPFSDHISVGYSSGQHGVAGMGVMDFIDVPRFAVGVPDSQSLIYAGTIVRNDNCSTEEDLSSCSYDLTVIDESELANRFIRRYAKGFAVASPMQTQLLLIPQSRTIEIRSGTAGRDQNHQE